MSMKRRSLLLGAAASALSAGASPVLACGGLGARDFGHLGGRGGGGAVFLPSTTITEVGVKGLSSGYIALGNLALPAGDWCLSFTAAPPTANNTDYPILSVGTQSDTILANNGNLVVGFPGQGASPASSYGWAAVGIDDAGNGLSQRQFTAFAATAQYGVSGPSQSAGANDGAVRTCFVQKSGNAVSFWQVDLNGCAIKYSEALTSFGAVAAKTAFLGCLGKASLSSFSTSKYQRVFLTAQALTPYQMEAIASGVDPRSVVTFSGSNGDLLFVFNVNPSDGQTYTDLIQGQVATAHGTFSAQATLLPATVDQNQIRFDVERYKTFQSQGATTDLYLSGTCYGVDGDIQVSVLNNGGGLPGTVQVAYTTVARSRNGRWSGVITCATSANPVFVKARKLVNAVVTGAADYFLTWNRIDTGIVIEFLGQSLAQQMRTNGSQPVTSGPVAFNTRTQSSLFDSYTGAHFSPGCSQLSAPGYGEGNLIKIVAAALATSQVMTMNDAVSGTSISQWLSDTQGFNSMSPLGMLTSALNNIRRFKPKYIIWHQGEGDGGQTYAQYYANLTSLYATISAAIAATSGYGTWYFLLIPVDNTFNSGANVDVQYQAVRQAQIDWVDAKVAAGDTKVVFCCTVNDILVADTSGDKIHKNASAGGYGVDAERIAQTILQLEGNQTYSGLGPRIASAHWNGDATVDVTFTHNGGTGLQTKGGGSPSGFAASLSNATPTTGPTFTSPLTISSTSITGANTVRITLSATPASAPYIWYQVGEPGRGATDAANGIDNALNDNRTPATNTTRGYPVVPTTTPVYSG